MTAKVWALVALLATVAVAQETGVDNSSTPTTTSDTITIHTISVGKAENQFIPNSINAAPGDIVTFQFFPANHSVIKSEFGFPCVPYQDVVPGGRGFFSGFYPVETVEENPPSWNLTVNGTEPIFFYCGAPGSCINYAMVGVINANASTPIDKQISLAKQASYMLEPGQAFPAEAAASASSLAATATQTVFIGSTPTAASGPTGSPHHHTSSGISTGAIAGIAVGAAVVALGAAALWFLLWRTRSLSKALKHEKDQKSEPSPSQPGTGHMSQATFDTWRTQSHYGHQLPPYGAYDRKPHEAGGIEVASIPPPLCSPPISEADYGHYTGGYQSYDSQKPYIVAQTSELRGDGPDISSPAELFSPNHGLRNS